MNEANQGQWKIIRTIPWEGKQDKGQEVTREDERYKIKPVTNPKTQTVTRIGRTTVLYYMYLSLHITDTADNDNRI